MVLVSSRADSSSFADRLFFVIDVAIRGNHLDRTQDPSMFVYVCCDLSLIICSLPV